MDEFLQHLKQRKLVQWAIAYVAFAFALLQGIDIVASRFNWPDAIERYFILALMVGFLMVLVLAWYHGERGAQRIGGAELLILALLLAIGGTLIWHFGPATKGNMAASIANAATPAAASPAAFKPPADSIVVLPFTNLSDDPKQQYFSNGITEELTNALGQNTGLTVIAWDTASKYAGSKQTPKEIGAALNVAHVLDGSIQRAGDAVRVTTELVDTANGRQLWSTHYDDSFNNIFAVQDKISAAIADALKVKFAGLQAAPTHNPVAHELYLKGLAASDRMTAADAQAALEDYQAALKLDPNYADAWAGLARSYLELTTLSTLPLEEALPKTREAARKALMLDPHNVSALVALGNADASDQRIAEAKAKFQQALALDPNSALAHLNYGVVLPLEPALAQYREAARLDPDNTTTQNNLATNAQDAGDWPQMLAAAQAMTKLSPHDIDAAFYLAFAYTQMQRGVDAIKAFDLVQPSTGLDRQLVDAGRLTYQTLLQPALRSKALAALDVLRRANISPLSQGDLLQLYLALGENAAAMKLLLPSCLAQPVGCNDLAINPMYLPLHSDPRFEKLAKQDTTVTLQ